MNNALGEKNRSQLSHLFSLCAILQDKCALINVMQVFSRGHQAHIFRALKMWRLNEIIIRLNACAALALSRSDYGKQLNRRNSF